MSKCQVCSARTDLFLCRDHVTDLRDMLNGLAQGQKHTNGHRSPGWLEMLVDTAVGRARLGDGGGRRGPRRDTHLDGEASLASHIEVFPNENETDLDKARQQRQQIALNHALAAGRVNGRASTLLRRIRGEMLEWVEVTATVTGVTYKPLDMSDHASTALWLAHNAKAIARSDRAGTIHAQVSKAIDDIERAINLPPLPRHCGPCPTLIARGEQCGRSLEARRDDVEVTCPACRETYNVEQLLVRLVNQTYYLKFTVKELLRYLPLGEEDVPRRTLYDWIAKKRLLPRDSDPVTGSPRYLMADVRKLRDENPGRRKVKAR